MDMLRAVKDLQARVGEMEEQLAGASPETAEPEEEQGTNVGAILVSIESRLNGLEAAHDEMGLALDAIRERHESESLDEMEPYPGVSESEAIQAAAEPMVEPASWQGGEGVEASFEEPA